MVSPVSNMEEAVPTNIYEFLRPAANDLTKKVKPEPKEDDEKNLMAISESSGWNLVKRYVEEAQAHKIQQAREKARTSGNLAEIGLYYFLADEIGNALQTVIDMVEMPKNARIYERLAPAPTDEQ